eukprot:GCRY01001288.1.p1 GENE.GCRY01001288.1~~GCRY01001288.1.p1  ORF type:complete len:576 (-),score=126.80 GCRY01001288.1:80-1807(-)
MICGKKRNKNGAQQSTEKNPFILQPHETLKPGTPVVLCVLDGVGLGKHDEYNAFFKAHTPILDELLSDKEHTRNIFAHGTAVGLPTDDDMGNSEVGHNAMGCGRIILQGASLVDQAIQTKAMFESEAWKEVTEPCIKDPAKTVHMIGLLSDGGVHSRLDQVEAMVRHMAQTGVKRICLHALADGRDVPDQTADKYIQAIEKVFDSLKTEHSCDAKIASGGGRMGVTMDRYQADWGIVEKGWKAHVLGQARGFSSSTEAITTYRKEESGVSDQFLPAWTIVEKKEDGTESPVGPILDGDSVITFNFRGDRMIEINQAFLEENFDKFDRQRVPKVTFAGMMVYDGDNNLPPRHLVSPPKIDRTSGEYLTQSGVKIFACSETQKFGHVTYFFNGNKTGKFSDKLEEYVEIPSDRVIFNKKPEMKALEIANRSAEAIKAKTHDFYRINIANGDMVGHTGDLDATITAMRVTDEAVKIIRDAVNAVNGILILTADHGNCEEMVIKKKGNVQLDSNGAPTPCTSHTLNPVFVHVGGTGLPKTVMIDSSFKAGLPNIAATFINLLGFKAPQDYVRSLLKFSQ